MVNAEPKRQPPKSSWEHFALYERVVEALRAAPAFFTTSIRVTGLPATDLHALNMLLGATIEDRIVETLNRMRSVWDPDEKYALYSFQRSPQTFPDVRLGRRDRKGAPILGIELKGWYLLAVEGEPSFRYKVTPAVCMPQDIVAIYPWYLSEVISGEPRLLDPFIEPARYVAEVRNWHWDNRKTAKSNPVKLSTVTTPYPTKSDAISDEPTKADGNFGRIARVGILDAFVKDLSQQRLSGIPATLWRDFLKAVTDTDAEARVAAVAARLRSELPHDGDDERADALFEKLVEIARTLTRGRGPARD